MQPHHFCDIFRHLGDNLHELAVFSQYLCVLAHEYSGDMAFIRFYCKTFMESSVGNCGSISIVSPFLQYFWTFMDQFTRIR